MSSLKYWLKLHGKILCLMLQCILEPLKNLIPYKPQFNKDFSLPGINKWWRIWNCVQNTTCIRLLGWAWTFQIIVQPAQAGPNMRETELVQEADSQTGMGTGDNKRGTSSTLGITNSN
jgi:hypothetical protein